MPPLKQPTRLTDIAMVVLADYVGLRLAVYLRKRDLASITALKQNLCIFVPAPLLNAFVKRILQTISLHMNKNELDEVATTPELKSTILSLVDKLGSIKLYPLVAKQLTLLLLTNLTTFKRLTHLEVDQSSLLHWSFGHLERTQLQDHCSAQMRNSNLGYLVGLICPQWWLKHAAEILTPENCPKLKHLTISEVDNRIGVKELLRVLRRFSELRELDLTKYGIEAEGEVSCGDIEDLLSANGKLERLAISCDPKLLTSLKNTHPSLRTLHLQRCEITNDDLETIAEKFPGLTSLHLNSTSDADFSALMAFRRLASATLCWSAFGTPSFAAFCKAIGERLVSLDLLPGRSILTDELTLLHRFCPNIENVAFSWRPIENETKLIVPSFRKLRRLTASVKLRYVEEHVDDVELDIVRMPSLEYLRYVYFVILDVRLTAIICDSTNFPRLSQIFLPYLSPTVLERMRRTVTRQNLDLHIQPMIM